MGGLTFGCEGGKNLVTRENFSRWGGIDKFSAYGGISSSPSVGTMYCGNGGEATPLLAENLLIPPSTGKDPPVDLTPPNF